MPKTVIAFLSLMSVALAVRGPGREVRPDRRVQRPVPELAGRETGLRRQRRRRGGRQRRHQPGPGGLEKVGREFSVLYFPAGVYRVTKTLTTSPCKTHHEGSGIAVVGEDPATTVIKWDGEDKGTVFSYTAWYSKISRLTIDGSGRAAIALLFNGEKFSTYNETAGHGLQGRRGRPAIRRPRRRLRAGGEHGPPLPLPELRDRTDHREFQQPGHLGLEQPVRRLRRGAPQRGRRLPRVLLRVPAVEEMRHHHPEPQQLQLHRQRVDRLRHVPRLQRGAWRTFSAAPRSASAGTASTTARAAKARSGWAAGRPCCGATPSGTGPDDQGPAVFLGGDQGFFGNTYSAATPLGVLPQLNLNGAVYRPRTVVSGESIVPRENIPDPQPLLPGTPPHVARKVFEVEPGADAATIQAAIDAAAALKKGQRPVVHLPKGVYKIAKTLVIPAGTDLQIIGDGANESATALTWTGAKGEFLMRVEGPGEASLSDFFLEQQQRQRHRFRALRPRRADASMRTGSTRGRRNPARRCGSTAWTNPSCSSAAWPGTTGAFASMEGRPDRAAIHPRLRSKG